MSYTPIIPVGGNAGWAFLQRTHEQQETAFNSSAVIKREAEHFAEKIGKISSPDELVKDYKLLKVALGAFGLGDEINSKFLIRKVLEEGTTAEDALANKLSDGRYQALSRAFGFDQEPPSFKSEGFAEKIVNLYKTQAFEVAVGEQDENMRLALGFERTLTELVEGSSNENTMWYRIMGTEALRSVFEKAMNLPTATGALDVDRQLDIFKERASRFFGTSDPADFLDPERMESLTRRFFVQADLQANAGMMSSGSIALTLLQSTPNLYRDQ